MKLSTLLQLTDDLNDLLSAIRDGIISYLKENGGSISLTNEEMEDMQQKGNDVRITIPWEDFYADTISIKGVKLEKISNIDYIIIITDAGKEIDCLPEYYYWIVDFLKMKQKSYNN